MRPHSLDVTGVTAERRRVVAEYQRGVTLSLGTGHSL